MAMYIRDATTHATVREIARLIGTTQEAAVGIAADTYLRGLKQARADRTEAILAEGAALGALVDWGDGDPSDDLYDARGLPR